MVLYNISGLQNALNIGQVAVFANDASNGVLFGFFFIGLFFIMMFSFKGVEFSKAFLTASFLCFLTSSIAAFGGFLNIIFPLTFLILMAITGLFVWTTNN